MQQSLCSLQFCCIVMKSAELFAQNPVFISITLMLIQFYEIACCTCKKKALAENYGVLKVATLVCGFRFGGQNEYGMLMWEIISQHWTPHRQIFFWFIPAGNCVVAVTVAEGGLSKQTAMNLVRRLCRDEIWQADLLAPGSRCRVHLWGSSTSWCSSPALVHHHGHDVTPSSSPPTPIPFATVGVEDTKL